MSLAATLTIASATDVIYTYDLLGRLVYVHYAGGNTIHYVYDAAGNRTQVATNSTNYAPLAFPDLASTDETVPLTFDPRVNDQDPEGDTLTITAKTNGTHGTVTINGGTSLTYAPTGYYSGGDSFTYTISDGHSHTATATVSMTVNFVNQPPVAVNDSITTNHNTPITFDPRTNDSDPEGDPITITGKTDGAHGAVVINSGTSLTYTPTTGYSGSDSFTYTISDTHGHTATATVSVTITNINQPPVAVDDNYSIPAGTKTYTYDPRINDSDIDGDTLTITAVSTPSLGTVTINSGTSLTSKFGPGGISDSSSQVFTYTISDGHGHTATATVTISGYCSGPGC